MELSDVIGWAAAACSSVSMAPQALSALRGDDLQGVSISTYTLIFSAVSLWLLYGALKGDYPLIATNILSFCTSGIVLVTLIRAKLAVNSVGRKAKSSDKATSEL